VAISLLVVAFGIKNGLVRNMLIVQMTMNLFCICQKSYVGVADAKKLPNGELL